MSKPLSAAAWIHCEWIGPGMFNDERTAVIVHSDGILRYYPVSTEVVREDSWHLAVTVLSEQDSTAIVIIPTECRTTAVVPSSSLVRL